MFSSIVATLRPLTDVTTVRAASLQGNPPAKVLLGIVSAAGGVTVLCVAFTLMLSSKRLDTLDRRSLRGLLLRRTLWPLAGSIATYLGFRNGIETLARHNLDGLSPMFWGPAIFGWLRFLQAYGSHRRAWTRLVDDQSMKARLRAKRSTSNVSAEVHVPDATEVGLLSPIASRSFVTPLGEVIPETEKPRPPASVSASVAPPPPTR